MSRWSKLYDKCRSCGKTDRAHNALGFCTRCYQRMYWRDNYARDRVEVEDLHRAALVREMERVR